MRTWTTRDTESFEHRLSVVFEDVRCTLDSYSVEMPQAEYTQMPGFQAKAFWSGGVSATPAGGNPPPKPSKTGGDCCH